MSYNDRRPIGHDPKFVRRVSETKGGLMMEPEPSQTVWLGGYQLSRMHAGILGAMAVLSVGCNRAPAVCDATEVQMSLLSLGSLVIPTTTTTITTGSSKNASGNASDAGGAGGGGGTGGGGAGGAVPSMMPTVMTSEALPNPAPVFVDLAVVATFACPVEGAAHASLVTSVGQFTNGLAASSSSGGTGSGKDGGAPTSASAGSAGVMGASVTVLLTNYVPTGQAFDAMVPPPGIDAGSGTTLMGYSRVLTGYTTLQITSNRSAQVQGVIGDVTSCWTISTGNLTDAGTALVFDGGVKANPAPCNL